MLLQQVLEELSSSCNVTSSEDQVTKTKEGKGSTPCHEKQQSIDSVHDKEQNPYGNHVKERAGAVVAGNSVASPTFDVKRSGPVTRHTSSANAQFLYKAAVTAKEIQVSGHGRLSAPALLANCLLSMISLSDDENDQPTTKIEDNPSSIQENGSNTFLKSFSQLHAEERNAKDYAHNHSLHADHHKKLQVVTCCLFPCSNKRNISSKSMGSTVELLHNSDELSSSNGDSNSRCRARINGEGGGALRSLVKKVLCKGSSDEAGTGSSIGDHEPGFDEQWANGTPISTRSHVNQDEPDMNMDNHSNSMYEYEYMYDGGYGNLLHVGKGEYEGVKRSECALEMDGGVAQEVVHEVISLSHDAPVASSFLFEQACFSSSSSTSSTTHCMKLESAHPWLIPGADLDSCTTSPRQQHQPPPANRALHGVMQDDLQFRLANKRLNLSR